MCAIFGSLSSERFEVLAELNATRGTYSHSFALFDPMVSRMTLLERIPGAWDRDKYDIPANCYAIGHCQAPTSAASKTRRNIHPAERQGDLLWHNGLVKSSRLRVLQTRLASAETWDTALILEALGRSLSLSEIDGSFACVWYRKDELLLFRNELCRLYYHPKTFDISTLPFPESELIPSHQIWKLDLLEKRLVAAGNFSTKENPYHF